MRKITILLIFLKSLFGFSLNDIKSINNNTIFESVVGKDSFSLLSEYDESTLNIILNGNGIGGAINILGISTALECKFPNANMNVPNICSSVGSGANYLLNWNLDLEIGSCKANLNTKKLANATASFINNLCKSVTNLDNLQISTIGTITANEKESLITAEGGVGKGATTYSPTGEIGDIKTESGKSLNEIYTQILTLKNLQNLNGKNSKFVKEAFFKGDKIKMDMIEECVKNIKNFNIEDDEMVRKCLSPKFPATFLDYKKEVYNTSSEIFNNIQINKLDFENRVKEALSKRFLAEVDYSKTELEIRAKESEIYNEFITSKNEFFIKSIEAIEMSFARLFALKKKAREYSSEYDKYMDFNYPTQEHFQLKASDESKSEYIYNFKQRQFNDILFEIELRKEADNMKQNLYIITYNAFIKTQQFSKESARKELLNELAILDELISY